MRLRLAISLATVLLVGALLPLTASAHIERASYWPDPSPDCSVTPCAGGHVPVVRSLESAAATLVASTCTAPRTAHVRLSRSLRRRARSLRIYVNGRRVRTVRAGRGRRLPARVTLGNLPGGIVKVRLVGVTRTAKHLTLRRRFHFCVHTSSTPSTGSGGAGVTRVVCQADSLIRTRQAVASAESVGYQVRPTEPRRKITAAAGNALIALNRALFNACGFQSIQAAVNQSGNNDRVVIMPGLYTEPQSRAQPTHDPRCARYAITNDRSEAGAVSYAYQFHCPNDQNLIAVLGRAPGPTPPPQPPRTDRHGIPDLGPCIRCNLQMEGSGVSADDVVIDAGQVSSGDHAPINAVKDVGIRADRADGFVLRNVKVRHAREHDIYVLESDGYLLENFKVFYAGEYGVLTFVEDHGLMQNCEAAGNGDSGLYPGAGADTGADRDTKYYPQFRYSQEIRYCDSHHNAGGYSGTDGNATHIDHNNFYDNALGFTTDVFTAPGHPGFPQDSDLIDHNNFYSNNFNPYIPGSDIVPSVPVPVGTGLWIAGGNDNVVRDNYFYDNWRRGAMVFAVPDQFICGAAGRVDPTQLAGCNPLAVPPSTSYRNQFYGNVMSRSPAGAVLPNGTGDAASGRTDWWWDQFLGNTGNCWHDNVGKDGTSASVTSTPPAPLLPSTCDSSSVGTVSVQEAELLGCLASIQFNANACPWFTTPSKP